MKIDTYDCKLPVWSLSYLIYGDCSGLEDKDIEAIDNYVFNLITECGSGYFDYNINDEPYFYYSNDIHNLGDTVQDVKYIVINHNKKSIQ